jgi:formamidopyrimidine-DNA glycosylase
MPELPEVEITRQGLAGSIAGATIGSVRLGKPLRWPLGVEPGRLAGCVFGPPQRRGKYLWLPLARAPAAAAPNSVPDRPDEAGGLLVHLGMSGALRVIPASDADLPGPHDHVEIATDRGLLRLNDPRRFGAVVWSAALDADPARSLLAGLGVEPLGPGFSAAVLRAGLAGRRVAVKQALLAGDIVVGVGNIYCSEALFTAGIDPRAPAGRISLARCERLALAIRHTLEQALAAGGSTLRDFHDVHGLGGSFQTLARVYGREGQPCPRCGRAVRRIVQGQRASYFCATCQRV